MYIEHVSSLKECDILTDELMEELFQIEDDYQREKSLQAIQEKAKELGLLTKFNKLWRAYLKGHKKMLPSDKESYITNFTGRPHLKCGVWRADDGGIFTLGEKGRIYACSHPIYPMAIMTNIETKTCKVDIAFKVRDKWNHVLVDRKSIASRNTIINLANNGIRVTSENAGALVQYLSDVEALNEFDITEKMSTSRLGWVNGVFMPYEDDVVFDNEDNLGTLFNSIREAGTYGKWLTCVRAERKEKRMELLIYLAASFASVLVEPLGSLPFIVDLWGGTGRGKTVSLMVATSVWADPNEGEYITDAKSTQNSIEIRLGALNSLPMTIDDMAQIKNKTDDFAPLIYMLCSGSSKGRATKESGLRKTYSWKNCILTNAEHSLISETMQGGAVNRIIDVECSDKDIFSDAHKVADTIRHNFGHAGIEFIAKLQGMQMEELQDLYKKHYDSLIALAKGIGAEKEEKQIIPMAVILTADELAERFIFQDGVRLDLRECLDLLKNKNDISEGIRAYNYLVETVGANAYRFKDPEDDLLEQHFERWGKYVDNEKVAIISKQFDKIICEAGSQPKAFLSWAKSVNILDLESDGRTKKLMSIDGNKLRCVVIRRDWGMEEQEEGFVEPGNIEIPFD